MSSMPHPDDRFDQAEEELDRGEPWMFRKPDAPNPLTIVATGWSRGTTQFGEVEFLSGVDRDGKRWSVLVGGIVLTKRLIEGLVEEWSDEEHGFVVVETLGRVQLGEVVSIKYVGDVDGANGPYPNFRTVRKPPRAAEAFGDLPENF